MSWRTKLWPERIVVFGVAIWFIVQLHRQISAEGRAPIGVALTVIGLVLALLRKRVAGYAGPMWGGLDKEAVTFLYFEFSVLIAVGGGTLLLRALIS